jgi:hypothetical protein
MKAGPHFNRGFAAGNCDFAFHACSPLLATNRLYASKPPRALRSRPSEQPMFHGRGYSE